MPSKRALKTVSTSSYGLVNDDSYLAFLLELLGTARKSIDIIAYSFAIGSAGGKLNKMASPYLIAAKLLELKKKQKAKLEIRLYIEGERETRDRNKVTVDFLKKGGVKVKYGATHAKGFLVDGRRVLFGSTNLTHQSITKNHETNLYFDDKEIAHEFSRYFEHLWKGGRHGGIKLEPPMLADGSFKDVLVALINSAKKSLEFSIYFFHHTEIETALIKAHKRGVKITGLVHNHYSFALSYVRRTRGTTERLLKAGIKNLYYGPGHLFTHSKFIIKDKKEILLGTGNWLHEDVKVHPQLYIHLKDVKIAKQLSVHLNKKLKKFETARLS